MITAYELYLRKQANELGQGAVGLAHLLDDAPVVMHWLHPGHHMILGRTPPPDQQPQR